MLGVAPGTVLLQTPAECVEVTDAMRFFGESNYPAHSPTQADILARANSLLEVASYTGQLLLEKPDAMLAIRGLRNYQAYESRAYTATTHGLGFIKAQFVRRSRLKLAAALEEACNVIDENFVPAIPERTEKNEIEPCRGTIGVIIAGSKKLVTIAALEKSITATAEPLTRERKWRSIDIFSLLDKEGPVAYIEPEVRAIIEQLRLTGNKLLGEDHQSSAENDDSYGLGTAHEYYALAHRLEKALKKSGKYACAALEIK